MTTINQKNVSQALHLARVEGFGVGFQHLCQNSPSKWPNDNAMKLKWFLNKCAEHDIRTEELQREALRLSVKAGFENLRDVFVEFGNKINTAKQTIIEAFGSPDGNHGRLHEEQL